MSTATFCTSGQSCVSWYVRPSPFALSLSIKAKLWLRLPKAIDPKTHALIGVVINKLETHQSHSPPTLRGYIAMLAVSSSYRGHGIATTLVQKAIDAMIARDADEIVLETEVSNTAAMKLYERLGFLRSKKLHRYYLNGNTAYRLVLQLKSQLDGGRLDGNAVEGERIGGQQVQAVV